MAAMTVSKTYMPVISIPKYDLYDQHLDFLYQIFIANLQTDKGKEQVCKYQSSYNAQCIYIELSNHCTESIIADQSAANKITCLTGTKLEEDSWRGTTESFLSYWHEKLCLYHGLVSHSSGMPDQVIHTLLENAISMMAY